MGKTAEGRTFEIALVGDFQSGKSTTFNALLGRSLAPCGIGLKTSACAVTARAFAENEKKEYAQPVWRTQEWLNAVVEEAERDDADGAETFWRKSQDIRRVAAIIKRFARSAKLAALQRQSTVEVETAQSWLSYPEDWGIRWMNNPSGKSISLLEVLPFFLERVAYQQHYHRYAAVGRCHRAAYREIDKRIGRMNNNNDRTTRNEFIPSFLRQHRATGILKDNPPTSFIPSFLCPRKPLKWYDTLSLNMSGQGGDNSSCSDEPLGLVLAGGGAKGAYQAGVWTALSKLGLNERIRVISGTSVGALNAAAFATLDSPDDIRRFWNLYVGDIVSLNFESLSPENLLSAIIGGLTNGEIPLKGLLSRHALGKLLDKIIPSKWRDSAPDVYTSSLECLCTSLNFVPSRENCRLVRFWLNGEMNSSRRRDKILASCAMPWCFSPVEIDGRLYVDGGWEQKGGDNLPIRPILVRHPEIRTIIVVRCNSAEIDPVPLPVVPAVRFVEIRPAKPLPGIFDTLIESLPQEWISNTIKSRSGTFAFDSAFTDKMFAQGYNDGFRVCGKIIASVNSKEVLYG